MNYKNLFKNFFFFCICVLILGWGMQWFFDGLIDFSEWKISRQKKDIFLGNISGNAASVQQKVFEESQLPLRNWQIEDLKIDSESAISVETDLKNPDKILFKKDEQKKLTIASLAKLMTAIVSLENYDLSEEIAISEETTMKTDEQGPLIAVKNMSVENLLYLMLIESSNHASYSLSEAMEDGKFVDLMNKKAMAIGLKNTYFIDSTGLDKENYSTAEDLIILTKYFLNNYPVIAEISRTKEFDLYNEDNSLYKKLINTNKLLLDVDIPEAVAGKTGFTEDAKECLLLAVKNSKKGSYLINVILGSNDRFLEMKKMIEWVETAYKWQ
ncbi:MAG: serine hydrolase [Patescibacteria group bacterium]